MKSKHEILEEFGCPDIPFNEMVEMYYPAIISAMQEYADQETAKLKKELEEAKKLLQNNLRDWNTAN